MITIDINGYSWDVNIIDNAHLQMRMQGTVDWAIPLHFNQVEDIVIEKLKERGLVNGGFFVNTDGILTDLQGPFIMEVRNGYATIYDGNGNFIPELTDVQLGWTDDSTALFESLEDSYGRMQYILEALNYYSKKEEKTVIDERYDMAVAYAKEVIYNWIVEVKKSEEKQCVK